MTSRFGYEVKTVGQYGLVENVSGTAELRPPDDFDSWIDFWSKNTGIPVPLTCQNDCCTHTDEGLEIIGAHVKFFFEGDDVWIAPLCKACNSSGDAGFLLLPMGTKVVEAT